MYIAIVQNNPKAGSIRENADRALGSIDALATSPYPPDLVIFPAYALTGAPVGGLQFSDAFAAETLDVAHDFMTRASLPTLIGTQIPRPMIEEFGFISESEVLYCKDGSGGALGFVDITNRWAPENYASSISTLIDGHTITVLLDEFPEEEDDLSESEIIVIMLAKEYRGTNSMFTASSQIGFLRKLAKKNDSWIVVANLVGAQDGTVFDGASIVISPDGQTAVAAEPFIEQVLTYNISFSDALFAASQNQGSGKEEAPIIKPLLPYEAEWKALTLCIRDYVFKNSFTDVVVGLSGGIDSAVTATLACDALGAEHVHGLLMPGPFSSAGSVEDAKDLADNLGIETFLMPITEPLKAFTALSQEVLEQEGSAVAKQNIQARIRTIFLMHFSNTFDWLLLNTGNKSEAAMGFSTLYGDTAGALAPLGNMYKSDVYGLANWRNEQSMVIPLASIDKEPSAELYDGQRDQDSLPPYDILDHILRLHIEEGLGVDQILEFSMNDPYGAILTAELVEKVLSTVRSAEYKRRQEPLAPSLGYIDMTADRDWPITNGFRDHHRNLSPNVGMAEYLGMIDSWKLPEGWDFLAN